MMFDEAQTNPCTVLEKISLTQLSLHLTQEDFFVLYSLANVDCSYNGGKGRWQEG